MTRALSTRLDRLEGGRSIAKPESTGGDALRPLFLAFAVIVAHHRGNWREGELPVEAVARALGCSIADALEIAGIWKPPGLRRGLWRAADEILEAHGHVAFMADEIDPLPEILVGVNALLPQCPAEMRRLLGVPDRLWPKTAAVT